MQPRRARVLLAKTALDGHWRGLSVVAQALRDAGFEVVLAGMSRPEEIVAAVEQEDADLLGLNVGGRVEVVERVIEAVRRVAPEMPIVAGGALGPGALKRLTALGVPGFPPGSSLMSIVETVRRLTSEVA
jgi:methylmalonyl-CoA mutase C-terminal domain/subunit